VSDSADRGRRPGGKPDGQRPDRSGPRRGQPAGDRGPKRAGDQSPRQSAERGGRGRDSFEDRDPLRLKSVRERYDAPPIPEDVQPKDLDRVARAQLKTLSKENADEVARHLTMAARLIDEDPALAHRHAMAAARRAGRIAVVRETLAITAYSTGDYALALRELRTYRRISGNDDQLPMMVDSERGLGRPEKALELGRSVERATLPPAVQVELAIAMSGARLDLGQTEAALEELKIPQLDPDRAFSWSPALYDAYAAVLEELGRDAEAEEWLARSDRALEAFGSDDEDEGESETIEVVEEEIQLDGTPEPAPHLSAQAAATAEPGSEAEAGGGPQPGAETEPHGKTSTARGDDSE